MSESDIHWGNEGTNFEGNMDAFSPDYGHSNQSQGTSSSRGSKRKASMVDLIEKGYEKMNMGINNLTNVMREGIVISNKQLEIAEKGLTILEKSKPRHYSERYVWKELENIGVIPEIRIKCYRFLCENEKAKNQFFGVPQEMRWELLYQLMSDAGIL